MPNQRGRVMPGELEEAHPFRPGRFAEAEPQERRGKPGSRGMGAPPASGRAGRAPGREHHRADESSGVNPLNPIDPSMPNWKSGDQ